MNHPRIALLLTLSLALAFGIEAFSSSGPQALWIAHSQGITKVTEGLPTLEIPSAADVQALAVDAQRKRVWAYSGKQLLSYDFSGHPVSATTLDPPAGNPAFLVVDTRAERVWLAVQTQVQLFDGQGRTLWQARLPNPVAGMTLDRTHSQLWVAHKGTLQAHGTSGEKLAEFADLKQVDAVDYDARLDQVWVAADGGLRRYGPNGSLDFSARLDWPSKPTAIAADQDGGLWLTDSRQVVHVNAEGTAEFGVAPPLDAAGPFVVSLIADARSHGAWVATQRGVTEYAADGAVQGEFVLDQGNPQRLIRQLALPAGPIAPQIEFTSPQSGSALNTSRPTLEVGFSGEGVDPGSLEFAANAAPLAVQCAGQPDTAACTALDALADGTYDITATVADVEGNVSEPALVRVEIDTAPPPAPVRGSIEVRSVDGQLIVTGSAGSVEGDSLVTLINARTGERVTVRANADGSFSAVLAGGARDVVRVYATDGATNQGAATSVSASGGTFSGAITLGASSPANGVTVDGDRILVTVDLTAPPNTGVTVNDVVAVGVPVGTASAATRFHAEVPLVTGANTLTVKAHAQDGRVVTRTISVTSRGPFPYRIVSDRNAGVAPLKPRLEVWDQSGRGIRQVQVDADANGSIDQVLNPGDPIELTYTGVGARTARVIVFDNALTAHEQRVSFVLLDLATVDRSIQAVWGGMNDALAAGDKATAMSFLSEQARETYGPVFDALMPRMPEIVGSFSPLRPSAISAGYSEYGINRTIDGVNRVFLIGFVTNEHGRWQMESM